MLETVKKCTQTSLPSKPSSWNEMSGAVLPSSSFSPFEFPAAKDFLGLGGGTGFTLGLGSVLGGCFFSVSRSEMTDPLWPLWFPLWFLLSCVVIQWCREVSGYYIEVSC